LVLGLFALRSGSLLPGILFHLIFNSLEILRARASSLALKGPFVDWFISLTTSADNEHVIQYRWPTLAIAAVIALLVIARLVGRTSGPSGATYDRKSLRPDQQAPTTPPTHPPVPMH